MRGAVVPEKEFSPEFVVDEDNGTSSLGIIFNRLPVDATKTITTTPMAVIQTFEPLTSPFAARPSFGRPEIVRFQVLQVSQLENPKNGLCVIQLSNSTVNALEYMQVLSIASNVVTAVRNYYPQYAQGTLPTLWPLGSEVKFCVSSGYPEPSVYEPSWTLTKSTILRYYELMGYARNLVEPYLVPQYAGERVLLNTSIPLAPINGYANRTDPWPIEFNIPSTVFANNHTWTYAGYLDYSRGLPKYQTNELSRKLDADCQSFEAWGGRVTCFGSGDSGALVLSGQFREAFTLNYFQNNSPLQNANDRVIYASPEPIDYPAPVLVYSVDDLTPEFNGTVEPSTGLILGQTSFELKRGGYLIPASQLSTQGVLVFLGGVAQVPGVAYTIVGSRIDFSEPPQAGTACDVRVITSDDNEKTLDIVPFNIGGAFDSVTTSFPLNPETPGLTNGNSLVFLGGVLQDPLGPPLQTDFAYAISYSSDAPNITFIGGAPQTGTTIDIRGVLSGSLYRSAGVPIVFMSSTDEISVLFDSARTSFPLTIDGQPIDAFKVGAENLFVNLGGVMQIPIGNSVPSQGGLAYTVAVNPVTQITEITFSQPPVFGTTCNIRILSQDEFITCPLPDILRDQTLKAGPGVETLPDGELIGLDEGLING
jgi:hypothetical protein